MLQKTMLLISAIFLHNCIVLGQSSVSQIYIHNDIGAREIRKFDAQLYNCNFNAKTTITSDKAIYCFIALTQIPGKTLYPQFKESGITLLAVQKATQNYIIYRAEIDSRGISNAANSLHDKIPGFYGIEPISLEDRISRKIYDGFGFASDERDSNGLVYAVVEM